MTKINAFYLKTEYFKGDYEGTTRISHTRIPGISQRNKNLTESVYSSNRVRKEVIRMYWITGILGAAFFLAPFLFGYADNAVALWTSLLLGGAVMLVSYLEAATDDKDRWEYWTAVAVGIFAIVAPFILGFGSHASSGGIMSGLQHLIQLLPLLSLALFSWYYPHIGGKLLMILSSILAFFYLIFAPGFPLWTKLMTDFLLFGFSFFAGMVFLLSTHAKN